jgi:hypothetical protein
MWSRAVSAGNNESTEEHVPEVFSAGLKNQLTGVAEAVYCAHRATNAFLLFLPSLLVLSSRMGVDLVYLVNLVGRTGHSSRRTRQTRKTSQPDRRTLVRCASTENHQAPSPPQFHE